MFLLEEVLVSPQQDRNLQHSTAHETSYPLEKKCETPPPRRAVRRVCGEPAPVDPPDKAKFFTRARNNDWSLSNHNDPHGTPTMQVDG